MHRQIVPVLVLLLSTPHVLADTADQAVQFECSPSNTEFKMTALRIENVPNDDRAAFIERMKAEQQLYIGDGRRIEYRCPIHSLAIRVSVNFGQASAAGMCGTMPGGILGVAIDGRPLLSGAHWDADCSSSVTQLSLKILRKQQRIQLTLCGYAVAGGALTGDEQRCTTRRVSLPVPPEYIIREQDVPRLLSEPNRSNVRDKDPMPELLNVQ